MRNLKTLLIALIGMVSFAQAAVTFYSGTGTREPLAIDKNYFGILLMDVQIGPQDTAFSRPVDVTRMPISFRDTGTGDAALLYDLNAGHAIMSCYDVRDSAAVTDSTDISGQFYVSHYAGNNNDPYQLGDTGGKNDPWATLGPAYSINAASAASAINEANALVVMSGQLDRYIRFAMVNNNATAKDITRCRLYWTKKTMVR